jgi:hypothetical protein
MQGATATENIGWSGAFAISCIMICVAAIVIAVVIAGR